MNHDERGRLRALGVADFFRENRRSLFGSLAFAVAAVIVFLIVRALHVGL